MNYSNSGSIELENATVSKDWSVYILAYSVESLNHWTNFLKEMKICDAVCHTQVPWQKFVKRWNGKKPKHWNKIVDGPSQWNGYNTNFSIMHTLS